MNEVEQLLLRADKYLRSAETLRGHDRESSVSRSYYTMFFAAEAALLSKGIALFSHKAVIAVFGEQFVKTKLLSADLGRDLHIAFGLRLIADYKHQFQLTDRDASDILSFAKMSVEAVSRLLRLSAPAKGENA